MRFMFEAHQVGSKSFDRSARYFPRQCQGRSQRRRDDRIWTCCGVTEHCADQRADTEGEGGVWSGADRPWQDRLIRRMGFRNVSSMRAAQASLPPFILTWNERFPVLPSEPAPAHRPWTQTEEALDLLLVRCEKRVLSDALTFRYGGTKYYVNTGGVGTALRGAKVAVHHPADDRLHVMYKEGTLTVTACVAYPTPRGSADEEILDARVDGSMAAHKPAAAIVSGHGGGIKSGAHGAPLRGPGLDSATHPEERRSAANDMSCSCVRGYSYVAQRGDVLISRCHLWSWPLRPKTVILSYDCKDRMPRRPRVVGSN